MTKRLAAITGGGSGIGEAAARKLASDGFDIAVMDIDLAKAEAVARELTTLGHDALSVQVDVREPQSVLAAFAAIENWRKPADVLVSSAGVLRVAALLDCDLSDFRLTMDVNVIGTFLCAQRAGWSPKDMVVLSTWRR